MAVASVEKTFLMPGHRANRVSIVVPVFEEHESLPLLTERIFDVAERHDFGLHELILVDDGSRDGSWPVMKELAASHPEVTAIKLRRNFGKATALNVGIEAASGDLIVTMDADLQDDPAELPRLIETMKTGYDLVSGWRERRNDPMSKTWPSWLYNKVTSWLSGIQLHDFNCGYKAYRREVFDSVDLYGEMHRYVPVLAHSLGFKVGEIPVEHHPRRYGQSKYGFRRFMRGFIDLLTVLTITRYARTPGHLFGAIGIALLGVGAVALTYLTGLKLFTGAHIGGRPMMFFGGLSIVIGVQILLFGLLSEMINSHTVGLDAKVLIKDRVSGSDDA
ncbi:MAG: glycosyltransferase family 2 protein [Alphaproteobacteria bacterium]|nr:glycosyltransferase family 2 protein [Alphaproteobacteria bacterium]